MTIELFELRRTYALSEGMAKLLLALLDYRRVTTEMIETDLALFTDAKVAIHKLRRRLSPFKIKIVSMRDAGYWLDDDTKQRILDTVLPVRSDAA